MRMHMAKYKLYIDIYTTYIYKVYRRERNEFLVQFTFLSRRRNIIINIFIYI